MTGLELVGAGIAGALIWCAGYLAGAWYGRAVGRLEALEGAETGVFPLARN
jgi:hypothetical protein